MKIRLRQKVDQGGAEGDPLLPGMEFEVYTGLAPGNTAVGVFIKLPDGRCIYLHPWQFTYSG